MRVLIIIIIIIIIIINSDVMVGVRLGTGVDVIHAIVQTELAFLRLFLAVGNEQQVLGHETQRPDDVAVAVGVAVGVGSVIFLCGGARADVAPAFDLRYVLEHPLHQFDITTAKC